jgi:hypothetical protein
MRDEVNEVLRRRDAGVRVQGVEFTRRGNIAITPQGSGTTAQILRHAHVIQEALACGRDPEEVAFEEDDVWQRFVVGGIPAEEVRYMFVDGVNERRVWEEMEQSHPALGGRIRMVRPLCRDEDTAKRAQISFVIAIEGHVRGLEGGAYLFGRRCWVARYHIRGECGGRQGAEAAELRLGRGRTTCHTTMEGGAGDDLSRGRILAVEEECMMGKG